MENEKLSSFVSRIAERGLTVRNFDGCTLSLNYDPAADIEMQKHGGPIEATDPLNFAVSALGELVEGPELYPGVKTVKIS